MSESPQVDVDNEWTSKVRQEISDDWSWRCEQIKKELEETLKKRFQEELDTMHDRLDELAEVHLSYLLEKNDDQAAQLEETITADCKKEADRQLQAERAQLRAEIDAERAQMRAEIEAEKAEIGALKAQLNADFEREVASAVADVKTVKAKQEAEFKEKHAKMLKEERAKQIHDREAMLKKNKEECEAKLKQATQRCEAKLKQATQECEAMRKQAKADEPDLKAQLEFQTKKLKTQLEETALLGETMEKLETENKALKHENIAHRDRASNLTLHNKTISKELKAAKAEIDALRLSASKNHALAESEIDTLRKQIMTLNQKLDDSRTLGDKVKEIQKQLEKEQRKTFKLENEKEEIKIQQSLEMALFIDKTKQDSKAEQEMFVSDASAQFAKEAAKRDQEMADRFSAALEEKRQKIVEFYHMNNKKKADILKEAYDKAALLAAAEHQRDMELAYYRGI